jgi:hypothetical protein
MQGVKEAPERDAADKIRVAWCQAMISPVKFDVSFKTQKVIENVE